MLTNKHFLITGAAEGIGLATAQALKAKGARLTLWDMNPSVAERAQTLDSAHAVVNITDDAQVTQAMQSIDRLDGVVHCAGIARTGLFDALPLAQHKQVIDVNLYGSLVVAYAALPKLKESRGSLVLIASVSGFYGVPEYTSYAASKAAVLNFAQALRIELEGSGVYVGVVNPHFVNTSLYQNHITKTALSRGNPLFIEVKTPQEIAQSIVRGLERKPFMISTGWRSMMIFRIARYAHFIAHILMRDTYRRAARTHA